MSDFQEAVKLIKRLERDVSKESVLTLMSTGVDLWWALHKAEEEAEMGQQDDKDQDITDLPEVPPQDSQGSSMKAYDALEQISALLGELITDPELKQQLDAQDIQRLKIVSQWLHQGPKTPMHLMKMGDVSLTVKAIIEGDKGTLVLKDAYSDYWDLPGGHVSDGETLQHALVREVFEETGMSVHGSQEQFVKVLELGGEVKPVIFYQVDASGTVLLSEEHDGYQWVDEEIGLSLNLGVFKDILYPGANDSSVMRPARSQQPGSSSGGAAFHAMRAIDKGMFNDPETAIAAIEVEHGGPLQRHIRGDGDIILTCPAHGEMWYVTNDGMAFEYWHPDSAAVIEQSYQRGPGTASGGGVGMGDEMTNSHYEAELDVDKLTPPGFGGINPGDYPGGHNTREDSMVDFPVADGGEVEMAYPIIERLGARAELDYDMGIQGESIEMTPGGQIRVMPHPTPLDALDNVMIEGEGGGIGGPGDGMAAVDVHTDVGGPSRRKFSTDIPIIKRNNTVKLKKALNTDPIFKDMKIIYKAPTDDQELGGQRYIIAGYASPVMIDLEGHKITHEALADDLPRFMADGGEYANLNVMHSNVTVGKILPSFAVNGKVYKTVVDEIGLFVVAEIRTDAAAPAICKQVIDDIEAGRLRSFSISGNAENPTFTCDEERCFYSINDLQLYEITLCEEGVNPEAKFDVVNKTPVNMLYRSEEKGETIATLTKGKKAKTVNESELMRYFHAFSSLFNLYHDTGGLQVVLYDAAKGEVVLPDHEDDDAYFPYTVEDEEE